MSNSSVGNVTHLNTNKFSDTIDAFKAGVEEYNTIRSDVEKATNALFDNWAGKGKSQFQSDYTTIYQQLTDIADVMYELYEALIEAQAAYVLADEEAAKMLTLSE